MKIISVVGARPNFMKIAPFIRAINKYNKSGNLIDHVLVHTGQHYDYRMSEKFFTELGIPEPDINLEIGSGSHAEQVGNTMIKFEKVIREEKPDWIVVVGDVNATLACSVTAKKECVKCCHIEAGLRSWDNSMPEEINRLVTDRLSDLLLTPDRLSMENLINEGEKKANMVFVGNIMIDTLEYNRDKAKKLDCNDILAKNVLKSNEKKLDSFCSMKDYGLLTMHRPSNVDRKEILGPMIKWFTEEASSEIPVIWPIHPRTLKQVETFGLTQTLENCDNIILLYPIGYLELLKLNMHSRIMLTDSGGLQEECCVLGTPFLTLRWNTERPITLIEHGGVGYLVGNNIDNLRRDFNKVMNEDRNSERPELWDGNTAERALEAILSFDK